MARKTPGQTTPSAVDSGRLPNEPASLFTPWQQYPFEPSPLYLNHSVVFEKITKLGMMEGIQTWPENYDPLRPYVGHWRKPAPFEKDLDTIYPGNKGTVLWFDATNNLVYPLDNEHHYSFTKRGSQQFVKPYEFAFWQKATQGTFGIGVSPIIPLEDKNFRFLATHSVRVQKSEPLKEWKDAKDSFIWASVAKIGYANLGKIMEQNEALKTWHNNTLKSAINAGPLPHWHRGYVDAQGNGFTVSMEIDPEYMPLYDWIYNFSNEEDKRRAVPRYHTHTLRTNASSKPAVDHHEHKNTFPYEDSGLYSYWHDEYGEDEGEPMRLGVHPQTYYVEEAVDETLFLEFMNLYYNNEELKHVLSIHGNELTDGQGFGTYLSDKEPLDPLFLDVILENEENDPDKSAVIRKLNYKRQKLKQHLIHRYLNPMQTPGGKKGGYKNIAAFNVLQDKVFQQKLPHGTFGSRESVYNYTNNLYESALSMLSGDKHKLIPNPYLIGQSKEDPVRFGFNYGVGAPPGAFSPEYQGLLTMGNKDLFYNNMTLQTYLYRWANKVVDSLGGYEIQGINADAVYGFPKEHFIKKYNPEYDYLYPWLARLIINTPSPTLSVEYPDNRELFINNIFGGLYPQGGEYFKFSQKDELVLFFMAKVADKDPSTEYSEGEQYYKQDFYVRKGGNLEQKVQIETFNFSDWIQGQVGLWAFEEMDAKTANLISFDLGNEEKSSNAEGLTLAQAFERKEMFEDAFLEFREKIEEFQNTRSVYEVLDPVNTIGLEKYGYSMHPFAHNEIMFYEIEKWTVEAGHEKIVQRYFIAPPKGTAKDGSGMIEFIDTQIKIDQGYRYKVNVYVLVVGNKYQYTDVQTRGFKLHSVGVGTKEVLHGDRLTAAGKINRDNYGGRYGEQLPMPEVDSYDKIKYYISAVEDGVFSPVADVFALNRPNIELLKLPYTEFQTLYVANKPPLYPNVVIYPYQNINNKLLFTLSQFVGKKTEKPISILPGDKNKFIKAAKAQNKLEAGDFELPDELEFQSDEPDFNYQVFRLEKHPTGWSDFSTALRKELPQHEKDFVDNLMPNQKYYYTFRTIDKRGYISNPSPIYQVELIDDSGAVYLSTKIVSFASKIVKENTKDMRKYVFIVPTLKQSKMVAPKLQSVFLSEGIAADAHMGTLFGTSEKPRKFKIRITSKSSGKKLDLNLKFVHQHNNVNLGAYMLKMVNSLSDGVHGETIMQANVLPVVGGTNKVSKEDLDDAVDGPGNILDKPF